MPRTTNSFLNERSILIVFLCLVCLAAGIAIGPSIHSWHPGRIPGLSDNDSLPGVDVVWEKYPNIKYHYSIRYPESILRVQTNNDYGQYDLNYQESINFGKLVAIDVQNSDQNSLDLKTYAENVWDFQVNDPNKSLEQEVGPLEETTLSSKTTYGFTLTEGFRQYPDGGGYTLGTDGDVYQYLIVEDNDGRKIIIHYLINSEADPKYIDIAEKMISTLRLEWNEVN